MTPTEVSDLIGAAVLVLTALAGWLRTRTAQAQARAAQLSAQRAHMRLNAAGISGADAAPKAPPPAPGTP